MQEIETLVSVMLSTAPDKLHLAAQGLDALTPIAMCTDARALRVLPPPHPDAEGRKDA